MRRGINSAERIKNNVQKFNEDIKEKRKKLKTSQLTIAKIMAEEDKKQKRVKEKLFQVQDKREFQQQMKSLKLQEQIESVERRLEQRKFERSQKKIFPSIKDMFVEKKAKQELENALKKNTYLKFLFYVSQK